MKIFPTYSRNSVIRAVALIAVVSCPLIANAQLGGSSKVVQMVADVAPAAAATPRSVAAVTPRSVGVSQASCADQSWPYFSKECLRGSNEGNQPRLVSLTAESSRNAATDNAAKAIAAVNSVQGYVAVATSKKPAKPRVASRRRDLRNESVTYAVNAEPDRGFPTAW